MSLDRVNVFYPDYLGEVRRTCVLCGGARVLRAEIKFKTGSTAPGGATGIGETLTGGTSLDTGVIETIELTSGAWVAGTAAGYITMTSPTGFNDSRHWGTDGETATSTTKTMTLNGEGTEKADGIMYPESELVLYEGRYYCRPHFQFRFSQKQRDGRRINLKEIEP